MQTIKQRIESATTAAEIDAIIAKSVASPCPVTRRTKQIFKAAHRRKEELRNR